jgi:hypothetical protein
MTLPRKLALRISAFVARHASPGWKEWAQAMSAEVAYIKSDWSALRWAFGSMRILLDHREAPITSLAQVPALARKFAVCVRNEPIFVYLLMSSLGRPFVVGSGRISHAGAILTVDLFGTIICGALLFIESYRLNDRAIDEACDDDLKCAVFYRNELRRYQLTMWIPVCAAYLYAIAFITFIAGYRSWSLAHSLACGAVFAACVFIAWKLRQDWRNSRIHLKQLDAWSSWMHCWEAR